MKELLEYLDSDEMMLEEGIFLEGVDSILDIGEENLAQVNGIRFGWEAAKTKLKEWASAHN